MGRQRHRSTSGSGLRKATGTFYTPQPIADYLVRRTLGTARARCDTRTHPAAARRRSGDGQRRVPGRRLPLSRRGVRGRAGSHRRLPLERHRRRGPRRHPADDRRALPVRRRPQPDGRPAGAAVALAGDAGGRPAAELSRSPPPGRRQPARRVARQPAAAAEHRAGAAAAEAACRCSTTRRSTSALREALPVRFSLETMPNDTLEQVRAKERALAALTAPDGRSVAVEADRRSLVRRLVLGRSGDAAPAVGVRRACRTRS